MSENLNCCRVLTHQGNPPPATIAVRPLAIYDRRNGITRKHSNGGVMLDWFVDIPDPSPAKQPLPLCENCFEFFCQRFRAFEIVAG